jgi:arabinofuranosyltransferase
MADPGNHRPARPTRDPRTSLAILAAVGLATAHLARFRNSHYTLDDAWITFRFARNLVEHGTLAFNLDQPPTEGMTNLLWTLLSASWIAALPDHDPIFMARIIGGALHLATVAVLAILAARMTGALGGRPWLGALIAGVLLAASGNLAFYATSGMETPLWTFLFALSLLLHHRASTDTSLVPAGAMGGSLGLLATTRPEGVLVGGLLVASLALWGRKRCLAAAVPFVLMVLALELFRYTSFDSLVPNTFHAKPPSLAYGIPYLSRWLIWATGGLGVLALLPLVRTRTGAVLAGVALVVMVGAAWSGGDWMPGFRRLALPTLTLFLMGAVAAATTTGRQRVMSGLAVCALLAGSGAMALHGADAEAYAHTKFSWLGRLASRTPGVRTVALYDIGRFGWDYTGSIYDIAGLTDAHLARVPREHGQTGWDQHYFEARSPELLLALAENPVEDPLVAPFRPRALDRPAFVSVLEHGGYTLHTQIPMNNTFWCLVFRRGDVQLSEDLWGAPVAFDFREVIVAHLGKAEAPRGQD